MSIQEIHEIETADGKQFVLSDYNVRFIMTPTAGGWDLPPINWATKRPYQANYENIVNYRLQPRTFTVDIRSNGCSREEWVTMREPVST